MGAPEIEPPVTPRFACRSCGAIGGQLVLDLGSQPLANSLLLPQDLAKDEPRFPLKVLVCPSCWLLQISDVIQPGELFADYPYLSSFSDTMQDAAKTAARRYLADFDLGPDSLVVEIGSNDGYLLKNFVAAGVPSLGVEPAANIACISQQQGIETLVEFFSADLATKLTASRRKADLILGNNVLGHSPDINDFVAGLALLLQRNGCIVLEFPYACDLIERTEFDTIYHEHVFYFTLTSLIPLFDRHHLVIFDVERIPIHGGSLRLFVCHPARRSQKPSVDLLLREEKAKGVMSYNYYEEFEEQIRSIKANLLNQLHELKEKGYSIAAYGASAKGSTLLNYCGIGAEVIDFIADRSRVKQGRLAPGTHLPIVPVEELLQRQPDYTLLLTWNFADEILEQQSEYRQRGGRFIIPIPQVRVI